MFNPLSHCHFRSKTLVNPKLIEKILILRLKKSPLNLKKQRKLPRRKNNPINFP